MDLGKHLRCDRVFVSLRAFTAVEVVWRGRVDAAV